MQAVILAGGLATRLRPLTKNIPKSMVIINNKPFLQYQLELLKKNGITDIVLCVGYLHEQIEDYFQNGKDFGVNIKYSKEGKNLLGTAGALKNAVDLLEEKFFLTYGDSYVFLDFQKILSYFNAHSEMALMVVYNNNDKYDKSNVCLNGDKVSKYDKNAGDNMVYIDYGVSLLRKEILRFIPDGMVYSLDDVFKEIIKQNSMLAFEARERFYEIGSFKGLEEFTNYILSGSNSDGV
jgi:N-acetyl-alpha-D-muramate 1-phosphate uridylyltransferase